MHLTYQQLNHANFTLHSLDTFIRHQSVRECWRCVHGQWTLLPIAYEENWSLAECQRIASDIFQHMNTDQTAFGAFDGQQLVGFLTLSHHVFGQTARYVELVCFQVSEPYRKHGIGRQLFAMACAEGKRLTADKLYISSHSSKESQAAYRALGCVHATEINEQLAQSEPCDVQLEFVL